MVDPRDVPGRTLTAVVLIGGVLFLAGGLIFLCAAVENAARLPIALALLVAGAALAAWAGTGLRRARRLSPGVLDDFIVGLAGSRDGEVTLAQVIDELKVPDEVGRAALARLEANGLSVQEQREGRTVYVFPGLKEGKVVRRCLYCGNEYPVREPLYKCPNCGGQLEVVKT
jgi:hypothetical protein